MKYMYSPTTNCFYVKEDLLLYKASDNLPKDLLDVSEEDFYTYAMQPAPTGKVRSYTNKFVWVERIFDPYLSETSWLDSEFKRVREELEKVQDADSSAIGTVGAWRDYRKNLRLWAESSEFPNKNKRPLSPDA